MENLISRKDAADRAKVNPRTVDNWRKIGLLGTFEVKSPGGRTRVYVDATELDALILRSAVPAQRQGVDA